MEMLAVLLNGVLLSALSSFQVPVTASLTLAVMVKLSELLFLMQGLSGLQSEQ